jgi:hypothetical protein
MFDSADAAISFEERHQQELRANPGDLHFVLRTTDGQTRFHPGETIPLTLEFSSDVSDKYLLDAAGYDRSGRLWSEEFILDRDGAKARAAGYSGENLKLFLHPH